MPSNSQNPRVKDKSFPNALKDLELSAAAVLQHLKTIDTFDNMQKQIDDLTRQLLEANQALEKMQKDQRQQELLQESMTASFEKRVIQWKERETDLEAQINDLKNKAKSTARHQLQDMEKKAEGYEQTKRNLEVQLLRQKTQTTELELRLQESQAELQELQEDIQIIHNESDCSKSFEMLETSLYNLAQKFFTEPLEYVDQDSDRFHHSLQSISISYNDHRLVPRARMAQSQIVHRLVTDIFKPICLGSPKGSMSMGDALQRCDRITSRQKAILRSLLMLAFEPEEVRLQNETIQSVSSDLLLEVKKFLRPEDESSFRQELLDFLSSAAQVWNNFKKGSEWIMATSKLHCYPHGWRIIKENLVHGTPAYASSCPSLVIFPQIIRDGTDPLLYHGSVWSSSSDTDAHQREHRSRRVSESRTRRNSVTLRSLVGAGESTCQNSESERSPKPLIKRPLLETKGKGKDRSTQKSEVS
ncbi:uncharacterized protein BO97DRAFT_380174 [Aspergillus homomorphus CBS 101889]|uniref:MEI5 protein n=1 Tax=Aspergillus homomorphus (strain CBS 101889) TaxID=1450537 RepID=A0A395HGC9_ASPHC|nr:hypothetical protein BO97DRAFT_380174 [Aspergillus homomorphus CBS 101889]RAL06559.1 hypothetical protein BO97DRAFT_380174 [Aspergillus homomorphus CBS 101889]